MPVGALASLRSSYSPRAPDRAACGSRLNPQNDANAYNHNFDGGFCYCERGKTYDPEKEDETMFQCIVCEEWLHESCTSLRPSSSTTTPEAEPPLIDHDLFDLMICDACVRKPGNDVLRRYAGAKGWMTLAPSKDVADVKEHDSIAGIRYPRKTSCARAVGRIEMAAAGRSLGW